MESIVISSENLITNRKARDMIGQANLVDSTKETLSVIKEGLKRQNSSKKCVSFQLIDPHFLRQLRYNLYIIQIFFVIIISISFQDGVINGKEHTFEPVGPFEDMFTIETLDEHANFTNGSDSTSPTPQVNANELQLNVKLFLREYNQEVACEAINYLISRLGKNRFY